MVRSIRYSLLVNLFILIILIQYMQANYIENQVLHLERHPFTLSQVISLQKVSRPATAMMMAGMKTLSPVVAMDSI